MIQVFLMALGLSLATVAHAGDPAGGPDILWGVLQQEVFPSWEARRTAAEAKSADRAAWLQGEGSFDAAYPNWLGGPPNRAAVLRARLAELDRAEVERAKEQREPTPALGAEARLKSWRDHRSAMVAAEKQADGLERDLVVQILATLEDQPQLGADRIAPIAAGWEPWTSPEIPSDATEAARAELEARAARADRWTRELDLAVTHALLDVARGRPVVSPAADIELASQGDSGAAARLGRVRDLVVGDRSPVDQALEAYWSKPTWPEPSPAETARLEALRDEPLSDAAWVTARKQAIDARLSELQAPEVPEEQAPDASEQARRAEEEAARAEEEAELALANADDARARRRAEVLKALAEARKRGAEMWGKAEAAQQATREHEAATDEALAEIDSQVLAIRNRRLGETAPDPDKVYRKVRELAQKLRSSPVARGQRLLEAQASADQIAETVAADRAQIADARAWTGTIGDPMVQAELEAALEAWGSQLDEESEAAESMLEVAVRERDVSLRALNRLREQRRTLRSWVSGAESRMDQGFLLTDTAQELALLGPTLVMRVRARADDVWDLPSRLTDFNLLRELAGGLAWVLAWVAAWLWTRSQAEAAARAITERLRPLRPELRRSDLRLLEDPVARFLRAFVDLLLGWALVGRVGALVPELGFVLVVYLQVALYRALLAAFDLAVIPYEQVRPALLMLRRATFDLARRSFRFAIGLWIARQFTRRLLWDVLGLDVVARLAGTGFALAFLVLLVWALWRWEPLLRARVRRRNQESAVVAFLAKDPESPVVQPLRGLAILLFFAVAGLVDLAMWVARERSGLAWLVLAFSKIGDKEEGPDLVPIPEAVSRAIVEEGGPIRVERPEVGEQVGAALDRWAEVKRRGLVALVGDRGVQMGLACAELVDLFGARDLRSVEVVLDRRLVSEAEMVMWLVRVLELKPCEEPEDLVNQLLETPPQAWVLRDIHHAWTRQVEGFAAMTTLFYVLNATSHHHFWVVGMHRLSWDFFASSGSLVDVGVFRTVVALAPLTAPQLRELCFERTKKAGFELDTTGLIRGSVFGGDPGVEEERGIDLFFRLLAEVSQGNPTVAIRLYARCLHPTDMPKRLRVASGHALDAGILTNLTDAALFALVALRVQDELGEEELVEVTNLPRTVVRATLRDLMARGLVTRDKELIRIPDALLPAVSRTLRRRHFLHLGVG